LLAESSDGNTPFSMRKRRISALGLVALLALLLAWVPEGKTGVRRIDCGAPTPVSEVPLVGAGEAVRAGPLWFDGIGPNATLDGYPDAIHATKMVIYAPKRPTSTFTVRGFECATGRSLRFWYPRPDHGSPLPTPTAASDVLRRSGTLTAVLYRFGQGDFRNYPPGLDYHGYILFAAPGTWKVTVRSGSRILGSAIFELAAPTS
jgi:hypothetical protein